LRRFKDHFLEFWDKLITKASRTIIHDDYLLPTIISWLVAISRFVWEIESNHYSHQTFSHKLRPLRHTATLAALQIVRSIIKVVIVLRKEQIIAQRQIDTEELKSSKKAKVKELKDKLEDLHVKVNNLDELLNDVFAG